jgi:hypothetical protein
LALKAEKLVELMMVSGIPTASGYEERIRFAEMEIVDRQANEKGLTMNTPSGHSINGWDVNVSGVRTTSVKRHLRYHTHAVSRHAGRNSTESNIAFLGVPHTSKARRRQGLLHWPPIRRFRSITQAHTSRTSRQSARPATSKERERWTPTVKC